MIQSVSFDNNFETLNSQFTLFQLPYALIEKIQQQKIVKICAQNLSDDCHLITNESIYNLKRTQNQNISLMGQVVDVENIYLKSITQTILCVQLDAPKYHLIYEYLKPLAITSFEIDLEEHLDRMFTYSTLMEKFVISIQQLETFLNKLSCLKYKNKLYLFDEMTHINLLRYVVLIVTEKKLQSFKLEDLEIKDKLMKEFVTSSLNFYKLGLDDDRFEIKISVLARTIISELVHTKENYNYEELWEAFWMMIPTYTDSVFDQQDQLFLESAKFQTLIVDTNVYLKPIRDLTGYIVKKIDKLQVPQDPMERMNYLGQIQKKFHFEQIQEWMKDAGQSDKQISDLVQKHFKISNEQIHPANVEKMIKVYPFLDKSNLKFLKLYSIK